MSCKVFFWDLDANQKFRPVTGTYLNRGDGFTLLYDVTNRNSFLRLTDWVNQIEKYKPISDTILIGNKCDLAEDREVTFSEGTKFAEVRIFYTRMIYLYLS